MHQTTKLMLHNVFSDLEIESGDVVCIHAFMPSFGIIEGGCKTLYEVLHSYIGPTGSIIVPTFTYSYRRNEIFDVRRSASMNGIFSEYIRKHDNVYRNDDPLVSFAGIGKNVTEIIKRKSKNCFGRGSVFESLFNADTKFIGLGVGWDDGYSFMMHLEKLANVPFREDRLFVGESIGEDGVKFFDEAVHFVRNGLRGYKRSRSNFCESLVSAQKINSSHLHGIGHFCFQSSKVEMEILSSLVSNPWCMAHNK